jgi:PAS domain S-box-containing protein
LLAKQYRELFDNARDAIVIYGSEGEIIVNVNRAACDLYGWSQPELIGAQLKLLTRGNESQWEPVRTLRRSGDRQEVAALHYR